MTRLFGEKVTGRPLDREHTTLGPDADAVKNNQSVDEKVQQFSQAAVVAKESGLGLNAGHDLNLVNLPHFASIPGLQEVSIGHALIVDALSYGLDETIKKYIRCLSDG